MKVLNCPFCNPKIHDQTFASSANFMAVYNLSPMLPGHTLILPSAHVESLHDMDQDKLAELFLFAREVTKVLCDYFNTDAFDWSLQEKEEAGQSVFHLHLHIIPRTADDLPHKTDWYPILKENSKQNIIDDKHRPRLSEEELLTITERLRNIFHSNKIS